MNKREFNQFREDFSKISPKIGHAVQSLKIGIKDDHKFYMLEAARDHVGVCFNGLFEKKRFPTYYFEIGKEGVLNGLELRTLQSTLIKQKVL